MMKGFKRRLFIQIGIAAGLIILFSVFIIILNADINKRGLSIEDARVKLAMRNQTIELLSSSNSDLKKAEPLLQNLKSILPSQDQLIYFKEDEIPELAKEYGVLVSFDYSRTGAVVGNDSGPSSLQFSMTISGSYENNLGFLQALEKHPYFMQINLTSVERTTPKAGGDPNIYTIRTNGKIFFN